MESPVQVMRMPLPRPIAFPKPPGLPGSGVARPPLELPFPIPDWLKKRLPTKPKVDLARKGKKLLRLNDAIAAFEESTAVSFFAPDFARDRFIAKCVRALLPAGEPKVLKGYEIIISGEEGGHYELVEKPILSRKPPKADLPKLKGT